MKVEILQENLAKGLGIVGRAVAGRSTLPVLSNVLLTTDGDRLKLSGNNFEIGINCWVGAKVEEAGAITLPARLLTDFVNGMPPERIDITLDEETLSAALVCSRYETTIRGIDAAEFPVPDAFGENASFVELPADEIRQMINQVVFAASTDESRPVFGGALTAFENGQLTMTAADGFRMSQRNGVAADASEFDEDNKTVIIPARALAELNRLIADDEETVRFAITKQGRQAVFATDTAQLITSVIEGKYPDVKRIIPEGHTTRCVIDTVQFLKTVKIAQLFARDSANIVLLIITPPTEPATIGQIKFSANSAEVGDTASEFDAVVEGDALTIALNAKYLIDALGVMPGKTVMEAGTPNRPIILRPADSDDFLHVIMPMHIQGG